MASLQTKQPILPPTLSAWCRASTSCTLLFSRITLCTSSCRFQGASIGIIRVDKIEFIHVDKARQNHLCG